MNNKANVIDVLWIAVFMFVVGISFIIGYMFFGSVNNQLQDMDNIAPVSKTILDNTNNRFVAWFDGAFLVIMVGLFLGSVILAFQIDSHPIFFPISIIIFIIQIIITAVLANSFTTIMQDSNLVAYANEFVIIPFVMANYIKILLVLGFALAWIIWGKLK